MKKHGMDFYKPRIELFWKSDLLEALRPGLRLTSDVMAVLKPSSSVFSRWANRIAFGMFCQSDLALSGFRKPDNFPENVQKFSDKMFVKIFSIENFQPWKFSVISRLKILLKKNPWESSRKTRNKPALHSVKFSGVMLHFGRRLGLFFSPDRYPKTFRFVSHVQPDLQKWFT